MAWPYETALLRHVAAGTPEPEVAHIFGISVLTVRGHMRRLGLIKPKARVKRDEKGRIVGEPLRLCLECGQERTGDHPLFCRWCDRRMDRED